MQCRICGKEFKRIGKTEAVTCSDECREVLKERRKIKARDREREKRARLKAERGPLVRHCRYCGKEFTPPSMNILLCSDECRKAAARESSKRSTLKYRKRDDYTAENEYTSVFRPNSPIISKTKTVNKLNKQAVECGLSYGKLMEKKREGLI